MDLINPVVMGYDWGSFEVIARMQARPIPTAEPEAELWMGAHPKAPARVVRADGEWDLDSLIAQDPLHHLGPDVVREYGDRLPFLLKLLAARAPLSIQAHPTAEQARVGFEREEAAGLARTDPRRTYVDDRAKPEMLVAVSDFEVLAGCRSRADALRLVDRLGSDHPVFVRLRAILARGGEEAVTDALTFVLTLPGHEAREAAESLADCARRIPLDDPYGDAANALLRIRAEHPDDVGVVTALLMRHRVLRPGETMFVPAGVLHAYLHGTAIEVLANSDNVVRAGLTHKHIDVPALLDILDATRPIGVPEEHPVDGGTHFVADCPEFSLTVLDAPRDAALPGDGGPRIVFSPAQPAFLCQGAEQLRVEAGGSAFVSAADRGITLTSPGPVYLVAIGSL